MGEGLKRVCRRHGGLTVKSGGETVRYTASGRKKKQPGDWEPVKMKRCPKCQKMTLLTRHEALKNHQPQSIGECFTYGYSRMQDEWSLCNERCENPKCNYIK